MIPWSRKIRGLALGLALGLVFGVGSAEAQGVTTGAISGAVRGTDGTPIEGARVVVTYQPTGLRRVAGSNPQGIYFIPGLEPGSPYLVQISAIGYEPSQRDTIRVGLAQTTRIDFELRPAAVQLQELVTTVESQIFSPTTQGTGTTIPNELLSTLPTIDRDFADFVKLTPQVAVRDGDEGGISVAGQNNRFNTIQVDGITVNDRFGLGRTGQTGGQAGGRAVGIEAVKEYQVLLAPYDVRQGNFTGALINAVTKSGTNELAGSAFFYHRGESFAGDPLGQTEFSQNQFGGTLGGPIARDKAFYFLSAELSRRDDPASGPFFGQSSGAPPVTQADVDEFRSILAGYGIDAGSEGFVSNPNPLTNLLARFDVNLSDNHRITMRYGFNTSEDDVFSRSTSVNNPVFALSSQGYRFKNTTHNPAVQLYSNFSNGSANELLVSYQRIRDERRPNAIAPSILVQGLTSASGTGTAQLLAGAELFSQGNELDQDMIEITDNFTMPVGRHVLTFGTRNEFYKVRNLFGQYSFGSWTFQSLDSLANGLASRYEVSDNIGTDDETGLTRFNTAMLGFYAQDLWQPSSQLALTVGLRADVPLFPDQPVYADQVISDFGSREVPSGQIMWSPRLGFNYDLDGTATTQIRGGAGIFSGVPAFVWMSNTYANPGTGLGRLTCSGAGEVPAFDPTLPATAECADGTTLGADFLGEVDLVSDDLQFPQVLRANLAADRRIAGDWIVTAEASYTKAINNYFIVNLNTPQSAETTLDGRVMYGTINPDGTVEPNYLDEIYGPTFNGGVYELRNTDNGYSYSLTGQLQKRFSGSLSMTAGYTYSKAYDVQSFTSSRAISNFRFGRVTAGSLFDDDEAISNFDRPHRLVVGATWTAPWERYRTGISLTYIGQSGQPYTYIAGGSSGRGDLNADGTNTNDPIYIPNDATTEMMFSPIMSGPDVLYTPEEQAAALNEFIAGDDCLAEQRGQIMERNSCRNPWQNFLDLNVRQSIPTFGGRELTLELSIFNVLNLLNDEWGRVKSAGGGVFNEDDLLTHVENVGDEPVFRFNPENLENRHIVTSQTYNSYQMQLGARFAF